jgi:hypothetical protein
VMMHVLAARRRHEHEGEAVRAQPRGGRDR